MLCPKCGDSHVRPSKRLAPADIVHRFKSEEAYRCRECHARFFGPVDPRTTWIARFQRQFATHRERERLKLKLRSKLTPVILFGIGLAVFAVFLRYLSSFS